MTDPAADSAPHLHAARPRPSALEFLRAALFLGAVGFGGGISVLANIRALTVQKRHWVTDKEFTNAATVGQMLPGGAAANALAVLGLRFHGVLGAALGYLGFCAPGAVAIAVLGWVYVRFGELPHAEALLAGLNAAVVGIILAITLKMVRTSVVRLWQMGVASMALLLSVAGGASSGEIALLGIASGLIVDLGLGRARLLRFRMSRRPAPPVALPEEGAPLPHARPTPAETSRPTATTTARSVAFPLVVMVAMAGLTVTGELKQLIQIAAVFFRTGLGAYGGGFAIIPSLHRELLTRHWLTDRQFADAVAVGKLTPGPVLLLATFIGYVQHGLIGAVVATLAILSAPFGLVVLLSTWLDRMRSRRWVRAGLRGLTPAVVGLMAAAALTLGQSLHRLGVGMAAAVGITLVRFEVNPVVMLLVGGLARLAIRQFLHV